MSNILSNLEHEIVVAFGDVKTELDKLFTHAPAAINVALADIQIVAPVLEGILIGLDPAIAPEVIASVNIAQAALGTLSATIKQSGATPTALSIVKAISNNLTAILSVAHVKNSTSAAKITTAVGQIQTWLVAIENAISALIPTTPAPAPAPAAVTPAPIAVAPVTA